MDLVVRNILLGISLAAPIGPSGVAVIQNGLGRGFRRGRLQPFLERLPRVADVDRKTLARDIWQTGLDETSEKSPIAVARFLWRGECWNRAAPIRSAAARIRGKSIREWTSQYWSGHAARFTSPVVSEALIRSATARCREMRTSFCSISAAPC